ncbi:MAG: signal peptidase II [Chitinispirillaceae bacterium]
MGLKEKNKWGFFAAVTIVGFFADWITKHLVMQNMSVGSTIPIITPYLEFFFVFNKGALFGLNPQDFIPGIPVNLFFYVFSAIAIVLLLFYYHHLKTESGWVFWGIALIMPGALGNLFDRVVHPHQGVVDFLKVDLNFWPLNPWPIFNIADILITVGVGLVLVDFIREEISRKSEQKPETKSSSQPDVSQSLHE